MQRWKGDEMSSRRASILSRGHAGLPSLAAIATTLTAFALTFAVLAIGAAQARTRSRQQRGHAARALRATDHARLRYRSAKGEWLFETGSAEGTIPGWMQVHMRIGSYFSGNFVIHAAGGVIRGHGTAFPHGSGEWESFKGSLIVTGGTGRYRHAEGRAGLYGAFNRRTYELNIKTTGVLRY